MIFFNKIPELYTSIDDLPIYNWFKINETNNLDYLLKDKAKLNNKQKKGLIKIWENIFDEFIREFGMPDILKKILLLKKDIQILKIDMYLTGNLTLQTMIEIKEWELKKLMDKKGQSHIEVKAIIEKFMGFKFSDKEVSVREYYNYIKLLNRHGQNN